MSLGASPKPEGHASDDSGVSRETVIPTDPSSSETISSALYKSAMRRLAAGVSVVTTLEGEEPHGFLASSVTSISVEPRPSLLVSANRSSATRARITRHGAFCVNVLAEDAVTLAERFAAPTGGDRFSGLDWQALATGAPAFPFALASFDCRLVREVEMHSHTILIGEVAEARVWRDAPPLLYFDGDFRSLGDVATGDA